LEIENIEVLHPWVMVMSGSCVFNQYIFQNVGYCFTDHNTIEPHLESSHNNINFQEENTMPIYDSNVITQVLIPCRDLEFLTQVDASSNTHHVISSNASVKEILANKSFLSCNGNINYFLVVNSTNFFLQGDQITFPVKFPFQEFHNNFQDRIETWLEHTFQMRFPVKKIIFLFLLAIVVHSRLKFSFNNLVIIFLLLMFDVYICTGMKELEWLHSKYDYT
jgi:hypothetical protein